MSGGRVVRDVLVVGLASVVAGLTAGVVTRRAVAPGGIRPLSQCEQDCIQNNPDDAEARLNCMLKCIADGKISLSAVLDPRREG